MRLQRIKQTPDWVVGLIFVIVLAVGSYMAFTKKVPWGGGTTFNIAFDNAQNLRPNTPIRIAGVEVGKVKTVKALAPGEDASNVTAQDGEAGDVGLDDSLEPGAGVAEIELSDEGLPLKEDARFKLRPRLFLEGNLFVEVQPGSPGAPEVDAGHTFPPTQTSNSVQLDQIFSSALQKDAREDLQVFLEEFGTALIDGGGAESFRTLYKSSPAAFRETSKVNEALLGQNPNDLSKLIGNLDRVLRGLGANEVALQDTVSNLATVTGSLAAEEAALRATIAELPQVLDAADPAFASLNASFPPLRAFSREILPGVRTAPETLREATPLLVQARKLSRPVELRGLVGDLRPTVPALADLTKSTIPFLEEARALSSCFNEVIIPWSNDSVEGAATAGYPHNTDSPIFKETAYSLVGLNGESRSHDANGQYIRIAGGGGTNTVSVNNQDTGQTLAGVTQFPIQGAMPGVDESAKTLFKPEEPCENQELPDLRAIGGQPPEQSSAGGGDGGGLPLPPLPADSPVAEINDDSQSIFDSLFRAEIAREEGDKAEAKRFQRKAQRDTKKFYKEHGS